MKRSLVIALDYDGTYTEDPDLWNDFIASALGRGHEVVFVTGRFGIEKIRNVPFGIPIHYTGLRCKANYMEEAGIDVDIIIDDNPEYWTDDIPKPSWMVDNGPTGR